MKYNSKFDVHTGLSFGATAAASTARGAHCFLPRATCVCFYERPLDGAERRLLWPAAASMASGAAQVDPRRRRLRRAISTAINRRDGRLTRMRELTHRKAPKDQTPQSDGDALPLPSIFG